MLVCVLAAGVGVQAIANIDGITFLVQDRTNSCLTIAASPLCGWYYAERLWRVQIATVVYLALLLALLPLFARWCTRPIAEFVPVVTQLGPQNLGFRIRSEASPGDVVGRLARALDDMMDRITAGYDGQRRFAANASHELRTPLAVQRTLIEVGLAQVATPDQLSLLTAQLLQTNERNERLIEGLLVLSEADQGLVANLPHRLDEIATSVIDLHRMWAAEAGITFTTDLRPRVVHGEDVLLERLITNLVQNALKYNRPGGTIHVAVGHTPALTVANTGQVVPPTAVAGLFEPFKRLASDRVDHSGGAGLGLTIARSITQAHSGTIAAEPVPGGGLQVQVWLPVDAGRRQLSKMR